MFIESNLPDGWVGSGGCQATSSVSTGSCCGASLSLPGRALPLLAAIAVGRGGRCPRSAGGLGRIGPAPSGGVPTHPFSGREDTSPVNLIPIGIIGKCDGVVTMRRPAPVTGQQTREIGKSVPGLSEEEIDALVDDGVLQVPAEDPQR